MLGLAFYFAFVVLILELRSTTKQLKRIADHLENQKDDNSSKES